MHSHAANGFRVTAEHGQRNDTAVHQVVQHHLCAIKIVEDPTSNSEHCHTQHQVSGLVVPNKHRIRASGGHECQVGRGQTQHESTSEQRAL